MVPFVLCFEVEFLYCLNLMYAFIFYLSSDNYWEIAAHSAYDIFSKYKYLIVNLVFPTSVFGVGFLFDCAFS